MANYIKIQTFFMTHSLFMNGFINGKLKSQKNDNECGKSLWRLKK